MKIQRELLVESAIVQQNAVGDRVVAVTASQRGTFSEIELSVTLSPEQARLFPVGRTLVVTLDDPDEGGQRPRKK